MVLASIFEFLFKYRPIVFEKGRLILGAGGWGAIVVVAALALTVAAVWSYRRAGVRAAPRQRLVLAALRAGALALVGLCLLRPALLVTTAVPQRNVVGILLDDSQSMRIADDGVTPRGEIARRLLGDPSGEVVAALAERFQLRFYRFAGDAERIAPGDSLTLAGSRTDLAGALDHARRDLAALPLAGLVLVSDGADNADSALTASLLGLAASGTPVHTVGIGRERFANDLELSRVDAPRTALRGSSILVEALVRQQGGGRDSAELVVEDDGQILAARRFLLPGDGQAASVRVPVALPATGGRQLTVRVAPRPGETVTRNNARHVQVSVVDRTERILYFEGEPRSEFAFLRRAVEGDPNLHVVGLQRTAENKYLRLGVEDSLDLVAGFPRTREELFRYRALVLGSVEAAAFTADQLRMIGDFVSRRGGGLLFLGGRRAFGEGGYRDTPIEDVLPVRVDRPRDTAYLREVSVALTVAGRAHPVTQLAASEHASASRWDSLPPVTTVNRLGALKPGATVLLTGTGGDGQAEHPVLAHHRYGRGKVAALAIQDAWLWRMHADVPVEDTRYESFIRALLRWLASDVPDRVMVAGLADEVGVGEPVTVEVEVRDRTWQAVNGAHVTARVTAPSGADAEVPLDWVVGMDGHYRGSFIAREAGEYRVELVARMGEETLAAERAYVRSGDVGREYFAAELRRGALQRIARETGGRYYTPETVSSLPRDIVYTERGVTSTEQLDLWDMPIVFLLLLGLVGAEWFLRRRWGLA
jgi:uncharacterized membrane protein